MAEARRSDNWDHTACLLAALCQCHSDGKKTFYASDFHPFEKKTKRKPTHSWSELRRAMKG